MAPIRCVIFDLDGVLVNSRILHYETFRDAFHAVIGGTPMTWQEHEKSYDGLSTRLKIKKLTDGGLLTSEQGNEVFNKKQALTLERLSAAIQPRPCLRRMLQALKENGLYLACASNSVRATLDATLQRLAVDDLFDATYANQDVEKPKPAPDMYQLAMERAGAKPDETLIVEDSAPGRQAAYLAYAHVLEVEDAEDCTLELIENALVTIAKDGCLSRRSVLRFQVVVPMAGEGSRFQTAGYTVPKPFIDVGGKPMIQWVLENMMPRDSDWDIDFHLIVRRSHLEKYPLQALLDTLPSKYTYTIHETDGLTEGAACSVLLAEQAINNENPLLIINSDQYLEWNPDMFYLCMLNMAYQGMILTFYQPNQADLKWSYTAVDANGYVTKVAEKKWISPYATVGLYGWRHGSDFVRYARNMIAANQRVNNEFYVCPVYNEAIQDGKRIRTMLCKGMWGLGVPEDLETFRREFCKKKP